jgi:hypothetical protein
VNKRILLSIIFFISLASNTVFATEMFTTSSSDSDRTSASLAPVGITLDRHFSPFVGSEAMFTLLRGYQRFDDAVFTSSADDTSGAMILGRFAKWALIEQTLTSLEMVAQHEIFGHGFRLREFNIPAHYRVGPWEGKSSFSNAKYNQLSLSQKIAISTGGVEATGVMANQLRKRWNNDDYMNIDSREASLYLISSIDQPLYVLDTKKKEKTQFPSGHDIGAYIADINQWHQKSVLTAQKLRRKILIDFLDPYLFYSAYSIGNYMGTGNQTWEYPMLPIGDYRYLPAMRTALAPYGSEYQLLNFIKGPEHNIVATLRYGNTGGRHSSAAALEITRLFTSDLLFIDGKVDLWNQPKLFTSTAAAAKGRLGAAGSLIARYRITAPLELMGQLGYKTTGFIPGEALKHSPIIRVGFLANL